jgi:hypothetical protein
VGAGDCEKDARGMIMVVGAWPLARPDRQPLAKGIGRIAAVPAAEAPVSGTEEHVLALEHFDGQKKRHAGVDASGKKNDGDKIPMIRAGDEFLAQ